MADSELLRIYQVKIRGKQEKGLFCDNMLLSLLVLLAVSTVISTDTPPNIVLIIADDLGWNDVGWNNPNLITPNMNKLAKKGVILDNLYVLPSCSPSRAAVLTGYYPYHIGLQTGAIDDDFPEYIPENIPVLAEKLKELNYKTHLVGKWHAGYCNIKYTPTRRGFDSFLGFYTGAIDYYNRTVALSLFFDVIGKYDFRRGTHVYNPPTEYLTEMFGRHAVEIINEHDRQQPLFLQLAFNAPHMPLEVPEKFEKLYNCVTDRDRRVFSGMVTAMDVEIGNVVKALEKNKLMENTLIFFMSDNGGTVLDAGNNLPYRGQKFSVWEGGTKSASFVYSKTLLAKTGYRSSKMIHATDLFPTFLNLAGGTPDVNIDGKNQWPALSFDATSARDEFVYNIDEVTKMAAIRVGDLKLIEGPPSPNGFDEIYLVPPNNCRNRAVRHWSAKLIQQRLSYKHNVKRKVVESRKHQHDRRPADNDNCDNDHNVGMYRLYNITDDPGERFNLACHYPDLLQRMIDRLKYLNESRVPAQQLSNREDFGLSYINDIMSHRWC